VSTPAPRAGGRLHAAPKRQCLRHRPRSPELANVRPVHAAVSDRAGEAAMAVPAYADGGESFYRTHVTGDGGYGAGHRRAGVRTVWRHDAVRLHPRRAGEASVDWFFLTARQAARLRIRAPSLFTGEAE
jgi:hypothetical protein